MVHFERYIVITLEQYWGEWGGGGGYCGQLETKKPHK